jgi:single-strand DNA-binding protein
MSTGIIPITGRVVKEDPHITFANSGMAITRFTVVSSYRKQNKDTKEWEDTDTTFYSCVAFGRTAENVGEYISRGTAVVLTGRLSQDNWTDKDGNTRTSIKVVVENIGEDLKFKKPDGGETIPSRDSVVNNDDEPPF